MTLSANLPASTATAAAGRHRIRAAGRRRTFDLRCRQSNDHLIGVLQIALDDLREAAVGDSCADLHRDRLAVRTEGPHCLRLTSGAAGSVAECAARASDARPALPHLFG